MSPDAVLDLVRDTLAIVCERPQEGLARTTALADIGADSLARVELADIVEERLAAHRPDLHIPDADLAAFQTVGDVADYLTAQL
jgi:acyl carrier protein